MTYFEEYLNHEDPDKRDRAMLWRTAIGLQAVDRLKTSDYLIELARLNIEGIIDFKEVQRRLDEYYKSKK
jgi:hypothetical protein